MGQSLSPRHVYSPAELRSDAIVHLVGIAIAAIAVPVLIALAVWKRGDWGSVTAIAIYGLSFLAMLICSALYNGARTEAWLPVLKRLDHSAIYIKIAGTYTPLVALTGGGGLPLLAGLWGVALGGTSLKLIAPDRLRWLGLSLYLGMGWVGVLAGHEVIGALSPPALALVVAGGLVYTGGVLFFLWEALPFHNAIWHGFVLIASLMFYAAILLQVFVVVEV